MITRALKVKDVKYKSNSLVYIVENNYNKILLLSPLEDVAQKDLIIQTTMLLPFKNKIICKTNEYMLKFYKDMNIIAGVKTANNSLYYNNIYHIGENIVNFISYEQRTRKKNQNDTRNYLQYRHF
jgi:hypothetical protein